MSEQPNLLVIIIALLLLMQGTLVAILNQARLQHDELMTHINAISTSGDHRDGDSLDKALAGGEMDDLEKGSPRRR